MREIYEQAAEVIIWLGEENDDSNLAINLISRYGRRPRQAGQEQNPGGHARSLEPVPASTGGGGGTLAARLFGDV
ncbi:hypothetical protein B0T26DRAFT_267408 [Lasiosphaeria miniovina]|uniref:Heterokaryon incompatibility domain-containing protein n=1 Tax=Lasiosphaeria miniovina TaxID=1954250 RepID=A0AA40DZ24_9PEZI|nr:uncharacterized protein B0T26DRAFT_267408 [Lasiosphaeria miniovina]KAK0716808.1 hypothetical protein B0T26DRAFT_267408 [Lasiosphaeria miniovina]